jgi:hypothetical protein
LELVLGALVAQLADVGLEPVQQLLADDSFDKVLHKTRLIARKRLTEEGFQAIYDWLKRAKTLGDRRAEVLHSAWTVAGPEVTAERVLVGLRFRKGEMRATRMTGQAINELAAEILEAYKNLLGFMNLSFMDRYQRPRQPTDIPS